MTLRYPSKLTETFTDYIMFTPHEYRSNKSYGGQANPGGTDGPPAGPSIILYMPNSTPAVGNTNGWEQNSSPGAMGNLMRQAGVGIAGGIMNAGTEGATVEGYKSALKKNLESIKSTGGPALRQTAVNEISAALTGNRNTLMALQRGEVVNPNVELIYQSPSLRSFTFDFTFSPVNSSETPVINEIIKNFKMWSAPSDVGNSMLKVPCIWKIAYMSGGSLHQHMNVFKKAACTSVAVQANPSSDMHNSFVDGMPVVTQLSLSFQEVDIIVREDHENAGNLQGF